MALQISKDKKIMNIIEVIAFGFRNVADERKSIRKNRNSVSVKERIRLEIVYWVMLLLVCIIVIPICLVFWLRDLFRK